MTTCQLCPHACVIPPGGSGRCQARTNQGGRIVPRFPQQFSAVALDPIEKKPLYHFYPGSSILSVGSLGCNMDCYFCQNHDIARPNTPTPPLKTIQPAALSDLAHSLKPQGNIGLAFTYNEPLVNLETLLACFAQIKERGMQTAVITNGCFETSQMGALFSLTDAFNIDLKGFSADWYKKLGGDLFTVQAFIKQAAASSHVELTTLVVPGENDSEEAMDRLAAWVASIDRKIPLHITRYFPRHRATGSPTPVSSVLSLCEIAKTHLKRVYPGNL